MTENLIKIISHKKEEMENCREGNLTGSCLDYYGTENALKKSHLIHQEKPHCLSPSLRICNEKHRVSVSYRPMC